jgi:hypothetical protein
MAGLSKTFSRGVMIAGAAVLALAAASSAGARVYDVGATFDDGTTLSGFISINASGYPDGYDLTTTDGSIVGYHYTPTINSTFTPGDPTITIFRDDPSYDGYLQLTFVDPLIGTGSGPDALVVGPSGPSYECNDYSCPNGTARFLLTSSVPEPAAWALMLAGVGGIGGMLRAARRRVVAA